MITLLIDPGNIESHRRPRVSATYHSNVWQQQAMRSEWPPRSCPLDLSHDSIDFMSSKIVPNRLGMLNVRMKKEMLWYHLIMIHHQGHSARALRSLGLPAHQPQHSHKITLNSSGLDSSRGPEIRESRRDDPRREICATAGVCDVAKSGHQANRRVARGPAGLCAESFFSMSKSISRYDECHPGCANLSSRNFCGESLLVWRSGHPPACRPDSKLDKW